MEYLSQSTFFVVWRFFRNETICGGWACHAAPSAVFASSKVFAVPFPSRD